MAYVQSMGATDVLSGLRGQYQPTNENSLYGGEGRGAENVGQEGRSADNYHRLPITLQRHTLMARIGHVVAACLLTPVVIAFRLTVACILIPLSLASPIILTVTKTAHLLSQKKESFKLGELIVGQATHNMAIIRNQLLQAVNIVGIYSHIIDVLKGEPQEE